MNAKGLMIGNYLKKEGVVVNIDARSIFDMFNDNEKYEPILLTEEWLQRFGFEIIQDSDVFDYYSNGIYKDFKLIILREEDSGYDDRVGCVYFYSNTQFLNEDIPSVSLIYNIEDDGDRDLFNGISRGTNDVNYVHQLQNIYFALTGVELQLSST